MPFRKLQVNVRSGARYCPFRKRENVYVSCPGNWCSLAGEDAPLKCPQVPRSQTSNAAPRGCPLRKVTVVVSGIVSAKEIDPKQEGVAG
jgi:hypothetical protein